MNHSRALKALDDARRRAFPLGSRGRRLAHLTRVAGADGDWHCVAWSSFDESEADPFIAAEVEHHRARGAEFEWTVCAHDRPSDLLARLRSRGFEVGPREAVMVLDLQGQRKRAHDWIDEAPGFVVPRVASAKQARLYQDVTDRAFGRPPGGELHATTRELVAALAVGSDQHAAYVVYVGGEPACAGRLDTHPDSEFAGLYGGGTLEEYRRQGLYRQLVAARAREARRLGARYLRVDALPTSETILRRLGFEELTASWPCTFDSRAPPRA